MFWKIYYSFIFKFFYEILFFFFSWKYTNTDTQNGMGFEKNTNVRNPPKIKKFQLNSENENFQSKQDINFVFMFQYSGFMHVYKWKMERICQILASWGYKFTFYFASSRAYTYIHTRMRKRKDKWMKSN